MIKNIWPFRNRLSTAQTPSQNDLSRQRGYLNHLSQHRDRLPMFVQACPVAQKYLTFFEVLDWDAFLHRDPTQPWSGPQPDNRLPFVAAFLVKLDQGLKSMNDLRLYLVEHPALVWILGFDLVPDENTTYGFDVVASVPTKRQFLHVLHQLDNAVIQALLDQSVTWFMTHLPPAQTQAFGRIIAIDTKHVLAWVKENNPKVFIKAGRYDKTRQPKGDLDCKLGVKKRTNLKPKTPTKEAQPARSSSVSQAFWGYASGIVTAKVPGWAEVVLAEFTQPFNESEVSYFFPLMAHTERRLGFRPKYAALDAGFDAFYIYQYFLEAGGFAAIPFSTRGQTPRKFDPDGLPLCEAGLAMPLKMTFTNRRSMVEHRRGRYTCPLLFPEPTASACPINHKRWDKGGCVTTMPLDQGARLRYQLDRESEAYKKVYRHRTATERLFALAVDLGIERPKLRNRASITNLNSLIYLLLNLRAIARVRRKLAQG